MHRIEGQNKQALIIGSGIGGLSMAIILSKLGFSVTVIEKNRHPGGMLRSYVRRGIHCNVGLHYLGALDKGQVLQRLFEYLGIDNQLTLTRMGQDGPVDRYHFHEHGDGLNRFDMPSGIEAYGQSLKETFPKEHGAIEGFMDLLRTGARDLDRLDFLFQHHQPAADLIDQSESLWKVLDRLGCSAGLKSVLSVPCIWFGVPPDRCPLFYHTMTLASYLLSAWRMEGPGTQMVEALTRELKNLGGSVICGQPVRTIVVKEGRVAGVLLKNGERLEAPLIIGAVHPKVMLQLLGSKMIKPSYARRINGLVNTGGMFAVQAIVPAAKHTPLPYNIFSMGADTDGRVRDVIYTQLRPSSKPEYLLLCLITRGHEERWQRWEETLSGHRGQDYEAEKMALAQTVIDQVKPITGSWDELEVIDTYTPLTIRDWVNSPDGSAYGVMKSDRQMLSAALLNRTSIKGLYLAGQSVMAPGVLGTILGSLATAKFIIGPERFSQEIHI